MLNKLICRFRGHAIARNHVWNDGIDFRTACARCRVPLIRDDGWREFDPERDSNVHRAAHPRHAED